MKNPQEVYDITDLLFPLAPPTSREILEEQLYRKATQEAASIVGTASPMALLRKTEEIYSSYLGEVK